MATRRCPALVAGLGGGHHRQTVWVKPTPVFGQVYWHFRPEPCVWVAPGDKPDYDGVLGRDPVWEEGWEGKERLTGGRSAKLNVNFFINTVGCKYAV